MQIRVSCCFLFMAWHCFIRKFKTLRNSADSRPFSTFVLPLMQGFVGQRAFTLLRQPDTSSEALVGTEEDTVSGITAQSKDEPVRQELKFAITLISRRSIKRPGLRYLRRGIDDSGDTANSVETEQILSEAAWDPSEKVYSFTQIRGSIPLFFTQSPFSFKPTPVLQHSSETNHKALRLHFSNIVRKYGDAHVVLLVDKHGGEAEIGRKYEEHIQQFNTEDGVNGRKLGFEWFDFHEICRGMKFENVGLLMNSLDKKLVAFGETVEFGGIVCRRQSGVFRINCMDCLDRTNVVQSACAQRVLEKQLQKEGVVVDLRTDVTTQWFNALWADNGDAISRQYSSTAALKGDYTRTRQRNYRGAINDLALTLSRYFNNIISDYFSQAAIDYLLGNVNAEVFGEFETSMISPDPGISMEKVRANAIETSFKIVVADQSEELIGGWTLLSPHEHNTVKSFPFEESVLLVTDTALYRVKFDFNIEKVSSFERIDVRSVTGIIRGTYITSTLTPAQVDESRNVGLVIKYRPGNKDFTRVNTRSLSSAVDLDDAKDASSEAVPSQNSYKETSSLKIIAFKAVPARSDLASVDGDDKGRMSEKAVVNNICDEIQRAALGGNSAVSDFVEDKDIISLQEARKNTGLLEHWGHSLKKMVWA